MQWENYLDFLGPDIIRLKGHRLGIEHLLAYYFEGYTPEEITEEFPGLSLEQVYATITYYLSHRADMDSYLARLRREGEREYQEWAANPSPLIQRLKAIRAEKINALGR